MRRLKIVFVSYNNGRILRGGEIAVDEYSKRLTKYFDVYVIQGGDKKSKKYQTIVIKSQPNWGGRDFSGTLRRFFFVDPRSRAIAKFTLDTLRELNKINPNIIIPVNDGWQSIILRIWTLIKRKQIIFIASSGRSWESIINLFLFPHIFITLTPDVLSWAQKINPFITIIIISNGVNTSVFRPLKSNIKIKLQRPIYLGVGAVVKQKNWELLIQAVSKLNKGSVLLVGQGQNEMNIDSVGKELLGAQRYKRIPKVPHTKLVYYYNLCNVFSMPSDHTEGQGIVYLEAMACNKPVVATLDPQRINTIKGGGILVDSSNSDEYAKALCYTSSSNWSTIPRRVAVQTSWNNIVKQFITAVKGITK